MDSGSWINNLGRRLPSHAELIGSVRDAVLDEGRWRWFSIGCSLGAGRADHRSDIDCSVGYSDAVQLHDVDQYGAGLVADVGEVVDLLIHTMDGMPADVRRFAVEYTSGVQLDLLLMPASRMAGLRDGEVAIVDKDGNLAGHAVSSVYGPPGESVAREWAMMGWWWISDVAKYIERDSLFEAADRIALVRHEALKLFAAARAVPYPLFGLTSLLDYPPLELPDRLASTYAQPDDKASVARSATAVADLLSDCVRLAATRLRYELATGWENTAKHRLSTALAAA